MFDFLYRISDFELFFLLSAITVSVSIISIILIRRLIPHELRYRDNPVIGNISSVIGIIYGVLVGLTALYLINNVSYTADAVQKEANSVANVYRDSQWMPEPTRSKIQNELKEYLDKVINIEWPMMKKGENPSEM